MSLRFMSAHEAEKPVEANIIFRLIAPFITPTQKQSVYGFRILWGGLQSACVWVCVCGTR